VVNRDARDAAFQDTSPRAVNRAADQRGHKQTRARFAIHNFRIVSVYIRRWRMVSSDARETLRRCRLAARHFLIIAHANLKSDLLAGVGALAVVVTDPHWQIVVFNGEPYLEMLFAGARYLLHGQGP